MVVKILLVNPYYKHWANVLPLGLSYLGAVLLENGWEAEALDLTVENAPIKELIRTIKRFKPNYVGLTATTPQIKSAWKIAQLIKKDYPNIKIIFGGVHVSLLPKETINKDFVDFVVYGEGEETLVELIKSLENTSSLKKIKGLYYKNNGQIQINQPRPFIQNLDKLPFPARHLFKMERYTSRWTIHSKFANILTSRGCPSNCIFCCNKKNVGFKFRYRSAQNIIDEIKYLYNYNGIQEFHIADDNFACLPKRVFEFCRLLKESEIDIYWTCGNGLRVDSVSYELLKSMRECGCYRIAYGIESGNQEILKKMAKNTSLEQVKNACDLSRKVGLTTVGSFIIGNYGDNEKTLRDTINFAKSLNIDYAKFFILTPFPNTPIFSLLEREKCILTYNWDKYGVYQIPVFRTKQLNKAVMLKAYKQAYKEFYFRPGYLLKRLIKLKRHEYKIILKGVSEIIKRSLLK